MEVVDDWIPEETFAECIDVLPQACVELVFEHDGAVLLARRAIAPARGEWFWPGSRMRKGETFEQAVDRVADEELGVEVSILGQLGVYNHFWDDVPGRAFDSRHTVNVVYHVEPAYDDFAIDLDDQHDDYRYLSELEDGLHPYVRQYLTDCELL